MNKPVGVLEAGQLNSSGNSARAYKDILIKIKAPHISDDDIIIMDKKSWIPKILIGGDESTSLNFASGSTASHPSLV